MEAFRSGRRFAHAMFGLGHEAKRFPPEDVKPFVRRDKIDAVEAAAIREAVVRPSLRFAVVRSVEIQVELTRHRVRTLSALRGNLAEIGVMAAQGAQRANALQRLLADGCDDNGEVVAPDCARRALTLLVHQIDEIDECAGLSRQFRNSARARE
jgi:transposase